MPIIKLEELREQLPKGKRLMGIDHGSKTWGLAVSNSELTIASPLTTIRLTKFTQDIKELAKLCAEYEVGGFIIGLPLNMDGSEGSRVDSVKDFASNLIKAKDELRFDPLIAFFDERLSTHAMEGFLIEQDVSRKKRKQSIDKLAAQLILQGAIEKILRSN